MAYYRGEFIQCVQKTISLKVDKYLEMKKHSFRYLLLFLIALTAFNSCKLLQPNRMFKTEKDFSYNEFKPAETKEYIIQPYDIISLSITTNKGLKLISAGDNQSGNQRNLKREIEYNVEYDGFVKLPTLGRVNLAGKTLREAEAFLEKEYAAFYQNPFVLIRVVNRKVYVFKGGGDQGTVINIPEDRLTLIEALAMSGGIPDSDKAYKIKLIRGDVSTNPEVYKYNISSLKDIQGSNLLLQANDIIYVESRPRYARRVLTEVTPYLTILSTFLLVYNLF